MSIEAMKQALEALEQINQLSVGENAVSLPGEIDAAMDNLRAAIEQPLKIDPADCHIRVGEVSEPISVGGKEPYDQTALELCEECGWRAMIPGDGCLVCARQKAKPTAWMYDFLSDNRDEVIRDWMTQEYADITRERGFNVRPLYTAPLAIAQKPVAYADSRIHGWPDCFVMEPDPPHTVPLYTAPQQWVGLTEEEYQIIHSKNYNYEELALAVEAKLKEKNT